MLKRIYQFALVGALSFGLVACGGEKPAATETETTVEETPVAEEETPVMEEEAPAEELVAEEGMEIMLSATGEDMSAISYEPKEFTVGAYTNYKLNFVNMASMEGMNHNAIIIPMDDKIADEIRAAGMKAGGPTFDPTDSRIIVKTSMLNPGENTSVVFETPGPGQYYVICTFPGHKAMVATMTVE